jgi:L-threonylcarbamoyladenylate synthase
VGAGHPLAVTSANLSGQPTPTTAQAVAAQLRGRIPLILDGGPSPTTQASSIVDLSLTPPRLLRQGRLTLEMLRPFLPDLTLQAEG